MLKKIYGMHDDKVIPLFLVSCVIGVILFLSYFVVEPLSWSAPTAIISGACMILAWMGGILNGDSNEELSSFLAGIAVVSFLTFMANAITYGIRS